MEIDEILKKNSVTGDQIRHSNFDADENMPKINDENFWDKVLQNQVDNVSLTSMEKKLRLSKNEILKDEKSMSEYFANL